MMLKKILATAITAVSIMGVSGFAYAASTDENEVTDSKQVANHVPLSYENKTKAPTKFGVKGMFDKNLPMSVQARFYAPHFDAQVHTDKTSFNGGDVGFKDTLGFGNDNAPEFIFQYNRFKLDYIHVHGAGDVDANTLGRGLIVDNIRYGVNGNVHSQSDFHYLKLDITNPIVTEENYGVDWMYGLTGMYWQGKVNGQGYAVDDNGNQISATQYEERSEKFGVPVPTLGIGGYAYIMPELKAYAQIEGLPLGGYGHFYDIEAGLHYKPIENFGINVGYRRIEVKAHRHNDDAKLRLSGPFAGISYDF